MGEDADSNISFIVWVAFGIIGNLTEGFFDFFDKGNGNRRAGFEVVERRTPVFAFGFGGEPQRHRRISFRTRDIASLPSTVSSSPRSYASDRRWASSYAESMDGSKRSAFPDMLKTSSSTNSARSLSSRANAASLML